MSTEAERGIELQRKYYTETAERYEQMHEHEASGDATNMAFVLAMLRMLQAKSVLDVGTASGRALRNLKSAIPELFVCGIEPVGALVDQAVLLGNAKCAAVLQGKGDALPFTDESFEVVCEFGILHHVPDPRRIVGEMLRVAKKAVVISDANRFGQGPLPLRFAKLALYKTGLWPAFNYLRTAGHGYQVTEGDGVAYSYSVYDSFHQVAQWADRTLVVPADTSKPTNWMHPLMTSGSLILCGIRDR
jgi:ubiquinone/menaquinone biosynthesis C-methylase UbiE